MKELTCIICPKGCHITVHDDGTITGNTCNRGYEYAKQEASHPMRTVTSTIKVNDDNVCVCPVKTETAIPKEKMFEVMEEINKVSVNLPIKMHQIIIKDVCGTGVNVIATKEEK